MAKQPRKKDEQEIMQAAMARTASEQVADDTVAPRKPSAKKKPVPVKPQIIGPKEAMITYIPRVDGDNVWTTWYGYRFQANIPKKVTNRELITSALKNPWFSVDGKPPPPLPKQQQPRDTSEDVRSVEIKEENEVEVEEAIAEEPFTEDVN